jgi:ferredoxin-NADP reductase
MPLDTLDATLVSSHLLTPDTAQLVLRVPGHTFSFRPGQHVGVTYSSEADGRVLRSYSPVSLPGTDTITLMVTRYDDGTCSVWLHDRAPGDTVPLTDASGSLHLRDPERDAVFLATGTGLTPMMSMLQAYRNRGSGRALLVYGERTAKDLAYRSMLDLLAAGDERLDVAYVLSQPDGTPERDGWTASDDSTANGAGTVRHGYIQDHLDELLAPALRENADIFACGVPDMVVDTREMLTTSLGVDEDRVFTEGWEAGAVD